ncbi:MAG: dephospho-CoA kinase [Chloroherpetonaceae bacterium]
MSKRIKRVGVTGGIGTGKTTVCNFLREQGCDIFSADLEAKRLQETDPDVIAGIKKIFGDAIYENGVPNRKRMAEIIFHDEKKLSELNALIHPKVFRAFDEAARRAEAEGIPMIAKEAAILFESGGEKGLDAVIVVAADLERRFARLHARGLSDAEIRARMSRQFPQDELLKRADMIIWNNHTLDALEADTKRAYLALLARPYRNG